MVNSKAKGNRGERELAKQLRELGFTDARRGQQFQGGPDSPDVVAIPGVHFECKHVEKVTLRPWQKQAVKDAGDNVPVIAHKYNRGEFWVMLPLRLVSRLAEAWLAHRNRPVEEE